LTFSVACFSPYNPGYFSAGFDEKAMTTSHLRSPPSQLTNCSKALYYLMAQQAQPELHLFLQMGVLHRPMLKYRLDNGKLSYIHF